MHLLDSKDKVKSYKEELEKELAKFYKKHIAWRMFWFRPFTDPKKEFDFEYTIRGVWDQLEEKWTHSGDTKRGPDWRISLPWKKETRGFPKFTCYLKGTIEMRLGHELACLVIAVLDGLFYDMKKTSFSIIVNNDKPEVNISVEERVRKIKTA